MLAPDTAALSKYLRLYESALESCDEARLALFAMPGKLTFASRDPDRVADRAVSWSEEGRNVYLHIHGHTLPEGEVSHRGSIKTARVAIGLFSDIDACGPCRHKPLVTLCPTVRDAITITEEFNARFAPLRVSILVGSGYGIYPLILFKEPLVIVTPEDREVLESLGQRFHNTLHAIASDHGWNGAVDRCDTAKVLRPPGTVNYKDAANPRMVHFLDEHDVRFTFSDVAELLPKLKTQTEKPSKMSLDGAQTTAYACSFILDHNAHPHKELFELTIELDPLFRLSWYHRRSDLRDGSQSGYDMSLAARAVSLGWPDQSVIDLVVCNRRLFGADLKRPDYYRRTLAKAKSSALTGGHHG